MVRSRISVVMMLTGAVIGLAACTSGFDFGSDRVDGSGNLETRTFDVGDFDAVEIGDAFEADVSVSTESATLVDVTADDNFFDHIRVEVNGDTLEVSDRGNVNFNSDNRILITVVASALSSVEASGATDVTVRSAGTDLIELRASGASELDVIDLDGSNIEVNVSGASRAILAGDADSADVNVSGASSLDLRGLELDSATVDVSGASNAEFGPAEVVSGSASGASHIRVEASTVLDIETSGSSSARRR